ncbi:MAG: hypothetical protein AAF495_15435 [Pseudomonadota bacterium]
MGVSRVFLILSGLMLALAVSTGGVAAGTADTLSEECAAQLNMSESACACIGARAEAELNDKEQAMVVAMVQKDRAESARLRGEMTTEELTNAGNFFRTAPGVCVSQ